MQVDATDGIINESNEVEVLQFLVDSFLWSPRKYRNSTGNAGRTTRSDRPHSGRERMGRGACQLGRTAGVEIGEEESGGSISGGRERTWEKGRFVATGAMREL